MSETMQWKYWCLPADWENPVRMRKEHHEMLEILKRITSCYDVVYCSDGSSAVEFVKEIEALIKRIEEGK